MPKPVAGSVLFFGLIATSATPAFAHAALLDADPAPNSTVAAPKSFKLTFSEKIVPAFSGFNLAMDGGSGMRVTSKVLADGKTMTGTPKGSLTPGAYKLSWHAASVEDGHRTESAYSFKVK